MCPDTKVPLGDGGSAMPGLASRTAAAIVANPNQATAAQGVQAKNLLGGKEDKAAEVRHRRIGRMICAAATRSVESGPHRRSSGR